VIDVLRHGLKHGPHHIDLFYGTPTPGTRRPRSATGATDSACHGSSATAATRRRWRSTSRSSSTACRSRRSSSRQPHQANRRRRRPAVPTGPRQRERPFEFGRCMAHFAVDDHEVRFCTHLKDRASWFLPFNQGFNDGAGNPPNPDGLKTDYLWKRILTPRGLTDILENYAQIVERRTRRPAGKNAPRSSALPPARRCAQVARRCPRARCGPPLPRAALGGKRKVQLHRVAGAPAHRTAPERRGGLRLDHRRHDRRILDQQIRDTIRQYAQVGATVAMRSTLATCDASSRAARRSSSVPCRSSLHPRRDRIRPPQAHVRDRHRRGALQPGGRTSAALSMALAEGRGGGGRDFGTVSTASWSPGRCSERELLRVHGDAQNKTLEISASRRRSRGDVKHRPSTATR